MNEIRLGEFDDVESGNTFGILDIMERIKETAPEGARVTWAFPGYVSIVLESDVEIAFGESLEKESGYSWNDSDREGITATLTLSRILQTFRR
jgi:hypothetical protein